MECPQEVVEGIWRGERPMQQAGEAAIARQDAHVFDALTTCRLDEHDRLELVELRVPAPPDAHPHLLAHEVVQAQGQQRLRYQCETGVRRQVHRSRGRFELEGEDALAHWAPVLRVFTGVENTTGWALVSPLFTHWVHGSSRLV